MVASDSKALELLKSVGDGVPEVDALCETKLSQFATVAIFERAEVEAAGVEIVPTFRTPT